MLRALVAAAIILVNTRHTVVLLWDARGLCYDWDGDLMNVLRGGCDDIIGTGVGGKCVG